MTKPRTTTKRKRATKRKPAFDRVEPLTDEDKRGHIAAFVEVKPGPVKLWDRSEILREARASVALDGQTHAEDCWKWHLDCAVRRAEAAEAKLRETSDQLDRERASWQLARHVGNQMSNLCFNLAQKPECAEWAKALDECRRSWDADMHDIDVVRARSAPPAAKPRDDERTVELRRDAAVQIQTALEEVEGDWRCAELTTGTRTSVASALAEISMVLRGEP